MKIFNHFIMDLSSNLGLHILPASESDIGKRVRLLPDVVDLLFDPRGKMGKPAADTRRFRVTGIISRQTTTSPKSASINKHHYTGTGLFLTADGWEFVQRRLSGTSAGDGSFGARKSCLPQIDGKFLNKSNRPIL